MTLGINVSRWDEQVERDLLFMKPNLIIAASPNWDILRACKNAFPCSVVYRHMGDAPNYDNKEVDPQNLANAVIQETEPYRSIIDAYQGYNECWDNNSIIEQINRELKFALAMQKYNLPVLGINAGVGNIETEHIPLLVDLWKVLAGVGYHAYCKPDGKELDSPSEPWYVRRPEKMWLSQLAKYGLNFNKLIFSETGTFYYPFGDHNMSPVDYAGLVIAIHEYALNRGMAGTACFTLAGYEPWQSQQPWELTGTEAIAILSKYNTMKPSRPPKFIIPEKEVVLQKAKSKPEPPLPKKTQIIQKTSPNFGYPTGTHGRNGNTILAIVDHIAAGHQAGLDDEFAQAASQVSAHFGVMRNGEIHQYVDVKDAAWGCGILNKTDESMDWLPPQQQYRGAVVNELTINIEHEGFPGQQFTDEQTNATIKLHKYLLALPECANVKVDRNHIVGHYRLDSVNRKNCPGPTFPWDELFKALGEGSVDVDVNVQRVSTAMDKVWEVKSALEAMGRPDLSQKLFDAVVAVKEEVGLQPKGV
jgi:N-acetyl-anhydromuramyl-L-alanine amidase AmpD